MTLLDTDWQLHYDIGAAGAAGKARRLLQAHLFKLSCRRPQRMPHRSTGAARGGELRHLSVPHVNVRT
jgi:hypothetical protein